jgi:hypothetical protein
MPAAAVESRLTQHSPPISPVALEPEPARNKLSTVTASPSPAKPTGKLNASTAHRCVDVRVQQVSSALKRVNARGMWVCCANRAFLWMALEKAGEIEMRRHRTLPRWANEFRPSGCCVN